MAYIFRTRDLAGLLIVPAAAYLLVFYAFPIFEAFYLSLGSPTAFASFTEIVVARPTWIVFRQTFEMAVIVTTITLLLSYPIAYLLVRLPEYHQRLLILLVLLPYWISTLVRSYAWIAILGRKGVINWIAMSTGLTTEPLSLIYNRLGATIGMVNVVAPIMILTLFSAFARIDNNLTRVGSILGGRPLFVFGRVWLPLSLPGVTSGCILVFLISLGVFTTPAILGGSTEMSVAIAIEQQVGTLLDLPAAAALSTLLLIIAILLLGTMQRFWVPALLGNAIETRRKVLPAAASIFDGVERLAVLRRKIRPQIAKADTGEYWREDKSVLRAILWAICVAGFFYLLIPVIVVIGLSLSSADYLQFPPRGLSLRWFNAFFASQEWVDATGRSFVVALIATVIATALGLAAAYGIERSHIPSKHWLYVVFLSPLVIPPTILAFGLYYIYAKLGWIGSLTALAAAHVVIVLPFVLVTLCQGIRSIDPAIEFAASSLGGKPVYVFWRITLPLLRKATISGASLAFLTSFDELIIALFLTSPRNITLPKRMWDSVRFEIDPINAAAAALLILLSVLVVSISLLVGAGWRSNVVERQA